ncbi:F-box domain-containing protein [Mycena venus]|uniref:F-box domain-containing protein n=1 Tax=Mycena venus TaxID=2733690 RepID=A0A8H7CD14_9AGAR|nr:F-box domain-containing protein [Mycena venus]
MAFSSTSQKPPPLRPNAITYKHLFRLLGYQYKTNHKPNNSRRKEPPGAITPPRQLFAEMMSLWFSTKFHPPASDSTFERQGQIDADQGLLTIVFRTFLYLEDYAGALVVLRAISDLGLEINERTYFIVLRYMARRVYYDVYWARRQTRQPFFAFELMGPFDAQKLDGDPDEVYEWIMEGLLKHNCEKGKDEINGGIPRESWRGRIPTVAEVLQQERYLPGGRIDHCPIVLMLQRALQMRPSVNGLPWGGCVEGEDGVQGSGRDDSRKYGVVGMAEGGADEKVKIRYCLYSSLIYSTPRCICRS